MKIKNRFVQPFVPAALAAIALAGFAASAHAQISAPVVSVEFNRWGPQYSIGAGSAGLVPEGDWTLVTQNNNSGSVSNLVDSTGAATTVGCSFAAPGDDGMTQLGQTLPFATPDNALLAGGLTENSYNGPTGNIGNVTLSNIPYASYDLIIYLEGQAVVNDFNVTLSGGPAYTDVAFNTGDWTASPVVYTPITASGGTGNYVEYSNLTGASQTFTWNADWDNSYSQDGGVTGFQIVSTGAVPEPATWATALCGLGMLLGFRKFRGRKA
jgi:hypothetical protein